MIISGIKKQEGTLRKLKNLLNDENRKVHGIFYTNDFFTGRYISRSNVLKSDIQTDENQVNLTIETRFEKAGIPEIENTLDILERYDAGDVPGLIPEEFLNVTEEEQNKDEKEEEKDELESKPHVPEPVSVNQFLYSVNFFLKLRNPDITYQNFKIGGHDFTLVNIHNVLDDFFNQTVTILLGSPDKMYLFSHFFNQELKSKDVEKLLELIVDENITGKAITGVTMKTGTEDNNISSTIYPVEELFSTYTSLDNDYIFNVATSYIRIPKENLDNYTLVCSPTGTSGSYRLDLKSTKPTKHTITIFTE